MLGGPKKIIKEISYSRRLFSYFPGRMAQQIFVCFFVKIWLSDFVSMTERARTISSVGCFKFFPHVVGREGISN